MAPPVELQRWLRDLNNLPYEFRPRAAGLHALTSLRRHLPIELPIMIDPEGSTGGLRQSLHALDERLPLEARIISSASDGEFVEALYHDLFGPAVKTFYFHMLRARRVLMPRASAGVPFFDRLFVKLAYPLWQLLMQRGLELATFDAGAAALSIDQCFATIAAQLGTSRFLGGSKPGYRDIIFAVIASPIILPRPHPASIPTVNALPEPFRSQVESWRGTAAGRLALRTYDERPAPVDWGRVTRDRQSFGQRVLSPRLLRGAARFAAARLPRVLRLGKNAFVSRWQDVEEVLHRPSEFLIAPINADRIDAVMGPFILGMDPSPALEAQRRATYGAMRAIDLEDAARFVAAEAERLADFSAQRFKRIDVVSGFARPVAARCAVKMFGIRGPSEAELLTVARAVFQQTFLNLGNDDAVKSRGIEAGRRLATWIAAEITRRQASHRKQNDLLDGLLDEVSAGDLAMGQVPWIAAGLLVGAIDTSATVVANIAMEIAQNASLRNAVRADIGDDRLLLGWCFEALRRRPHNPLLLRQTASETSLAGKSLAKSTKVWALTLAAMQDARVFSRPHALDPTRPLDLYLHFGSGLHRCAGRRINVRHIPLMVRALLVQNPTGLHDLRYRGPFPDRVVVDVKGR